MSEYKTFRCDRCGKHEANRLEFAVDTETDPADGKRFNVTGSADPCATHMLQFAQLLVKEQPMEKQRSMWKTWKEQRKS